MVRFAIRVANEPARRFRLLWNTFGFLLAGLYVALGALYLAFGDNAYQGTSLNLVSTIEGSLRVHGAICIGLGLLFTYGLHEYRRLTKYTLLAMVVYLFWTMVLLFGQGLIASISYTAVPWYCFALGSGLALWVLAPPLGDNGRVYDGRPSRGRTRRA